MFTNNEKKLKSGWKIALAFVLLMITGIAVEIFVFAVLIVFDNFSSSSIVFNSEYLSEILSSEIFFYSSIIVSNILTIFISIFLWKLIEKKKAEEFGLISLGKGIKELVIGLLIGSLSIVVIVIILKVKGDINFKGVFEKIQITEHLILGAILFVMVGLGEEIFSRGYCLSVLRQTNNKYLSVFISAAIFSFMHVLNPNITLIGVMNIFLVGILFAYMTIAVGNLWMAIGYHISWNYVQGYIFGFEVSGIKTKSLIKLEVHSENILNGGKFGLEGGLVTTIVILTGLLVTNFIYKKKVKRKKC